MNIVPITPEQPDDLPTGWDAFWTLFPRRVARKDARRAWERISASEHDAILMALIEWRKVWARTEVQFIPHAATWLNGERWTDELPTVANPQQISSAHTIFAPTVAPVRGEMPEAVKAALRKLTGRT